MILQLSQIRFTEALTFIAETLWVFDASCARETYILPIPVIHCNLAAALTLNPGQNLEKPARKTAFPPN